MRTPVLLLVLAAIARVPFEASGRQPVVGPAGDGATVVPNSQLVRPAGDTVEIPARPVDLALSPDGRFVFLKESKGVTVLDAAAWTFRSRLALGDDPASMTGLAVSAGGDLVYVTDATTGLHVLAMSPEGTLANRTRIDLPGPEPKENSFPCGIALTADGAKAYVCLSRNNTLGVVDLASGVLTSSIPVGVAPYAVVLSPDGARAYVSAWGGRRPTDSEPSANSSGTRALTDSRGIAGSGGICIVDLLAGKETAYIETGLSASGLALTPDGTTLFVANCNQDTISIVDAGAGTVRHQLVVRPDPGLPFGSMPSALALSPDARTLYATCSGNNALAVIDIARERDAGPSITGWIPTGWYPAAVTATSTRLLIANIKGVGSRTARSDGSFNSHKHRGSAQRVPIPDQAALAVMSRQAIEGARLPRVLKAIERTEHAERTPPVPIPAAPGQPSTFEHVIYVIKENRTYDQVFGDLAQGEKPRGRGKPELCIFGRDITPNAHALAERYVLLDNYYCNGVLSADGHSWATEGNTTPYLERSFGGFKRTYTFGDDPLTYSSSGFIWDHILAAGFSFRNYGEFNDTGITPPEGKGKRWMDVYTDWKSGANAYRFPASIGIENLRRYSDPDAPGWNLDIPDQVRADHFIRALAGFEAQGVMPNFIIIHLPNDHTMGVSENNPTPRACVADNDLALGRIVEAVSRSRFWPKACLFINEDDPQDGWDHIDGHRSVCLVVSPYTKRGEVVSEFYNQASVVHTIERIFGLAAVNQLYAAAPLMTACFTGTPDATPYVALTPAVALDELTPPKPKPPPKPGDGAAPPSQKDGGPPSPTGGLDLYAITARQDLSKPDRVNDGEFNLVLWHAQMGLGSRYPIELAGAHGKGLGALGLAPDPADDDDDD